MSQYTMELREIIDRGVELFDFEYPIFDESYRAVFEEKFKNHFYFREIGQETAGQFKWYLKSKLNEIMPVYNKKYAAMAINQRITDNYDVTESMSSTTDNDTTQNENGSTANTKIYSDTPQGRIDFSDASYATELTTENVDDNTTATSSGKTTSSWVRTMTGNIGIQTDAWAIKQYIDGLINVDEEVFKDLSVLFMGIY